MTYLIDTNVLCEPTKREPNSVVVKWLRDNEGSLIVNPIILGEIDFGILSLADGKYKSELREWFQKVAVMLQIFEIDQRTALIWSKLLHDLKKVGRTMPISDSLIAATALQYDLVIVTRDLKDYQFCGAKIFNPFTSESF
jgi:toxin FitB